MAAAGANTKATLNGLFYEIYANRIENLIPENTVLLKMIPFLSGEKELGSKYHQPVQLSHEHGITYAGADDGAFSLNDPVAAIYKDATIEGTQLLLRSTMSYQAAFKASTSKKAFVKATALIVQNMVNSISKRLEINMLYGQADNGIGKPSAIANSNSGSSRAYTFSSSEWAAGIWAGQEEALVDVVRISSNTAVSASFTIKSVDLTARTLTLEAATAVHTIARALVTGSSGVALVFKGALGKEFAGLNKIITNTSSLFGINATTFNLWKGNVSTITTALSLAKIYDAVALAVERGLDEDVVCLVAPKVWSDLSNDEAALRQFDSSYKSSDAQRGQEKISFFGQNGKIDIVSHIFVKEGESYILPPRRCKRVGATDVSFRMPGRTQQEDFFTELASAAGYELRCYTSQALFCDTPARLVLIDGINP